MSKKKIHRNVPPLTQRLANNPASRAFVLLADEYLRKNLLEDAMTVLTEGIQHHPTYVAARMMLGKTYHAAGRVSEARREFEEVVRLHPENILAYKKLASLYKDAGQLGETVAICNKTLRIDPNDKQAKWLLACAQEEISAVEDRGDDSVVPDWPQYRPETLQEALPPPPLEIVEPEIAEEFLDEVPVTDDLLKSEFVSDEGGEELSTEVLSEEVPLLLSTDEQSPVEEEVSLAFTEKTVYNRPSLYQVRLEEWLVSIQEKGVRA